MITRRQYLSYAAIFSAMGLLPKMAKAQALDWDKIVQMAKGQEVYFNAWAGDERINAFIAWAGEQIKSQYNVILHHVKLSDTGEAVSRIIAEKAAGHDKDGSVDMIWLNGENFASLKNKKLLFGPFTHYLPNILFADNEANPALTHDFTVPVEGMEAPWGLAQLVFFYHSGRLMAPPTNLEELLAWAEKNKGHFTYPAPPEFIGTTFLKQVLLERSADLSVFSKPATPEDFTKASQVLWDYLDKLHPLLWREGRAFPKNSAQQKQMVNDGEVDIYFAFNPGDASSAIAQGLLPKEVKPILWSNGTIANAHFIAIPQNAKAKEGAMVAVNFLLSPLAQIRKQDPAQWGDPTVLTPNLLMPKDKEQLEKLPLGPATLSAEQLSKKLPEPHPSWVDLIEKEWARRYAS